ncbi:MAG TPA: Ni,Fe-hydrogenase III large subunit [Pseudoduganella sp.]
MTPAALDLPFQRQPGVLPMWRAPVEAWQWRAAPAQVLAAGGQLLTLWASERPAGYAIAAAYALPEGLVWLELALPGEAPCYPGLEAAFPAAARMQRAQADLLGVHADMADQRPWLSHGCWPAGHYPLRSSAAPVAPGPADDYPFVPVAGEGVHEIPVGPVHAGVIEPGHFRFAVVGEKVLRLEQRLGYTHRGIDRLLAGSEVQRGLRLAGRVAGDSTVAFAWAYCMALESAAGLAVAAPAEALRAVMLERERVANHLGDLGALANDAGFAFGLSQFMLLKEAWLRRNGELFGHRFAMDVLAPGGVARVPPPAAWPQLVQDCLQLERSVRELHAIYDGHAGLQDRLIATGRVAPALAARLGLCGLAGRASSQCRDLRCDLPWPPYAALAPRMACHRNGDVAARVTVRFEEIEESLRLIRLLCEQLGEQAPQPAASFTAPQQGQAIGWVEGWRGPVLVALELEGGRIARGHCHDPSWHNWPALEYAIHGNIVPDFPLINKSFNLCYAGVDL